VSLPIRTFPFKWNTPKDIFSRDQNIFTRKELLYPNIRTLNTPKMKNTTLFVVISLLSLSSFAAPKKPTSHRSKAYVYMKHGKLLEKYHGHIRVVTKDIMLVNSTTIHPNGSVDAGSGENFQLTEGQYMTMDGRIKKFKTKK